ncbi:MAG TPA: histone deacetylase [Thermodesulfovibrionales bacterium]|nr:histone deacetylase [Thermodesulfovibrionales bacterium]
MKVGFVYDEVFLQHETPRWHPECKERLISVVSTLKETPLWNNLVHIKPRKASFADIETVHQHRYVEKVERFGEGYIDPDTYISGRSIDAALYAAGAVMEAAERCKKGEVSRVFCAVRPPGHHAEADRAMGFCIFNNVAVGTRFAQKIGFERVFIIDFDVHHGNGTQHIFEEDESVYYFSTHQYPHYPGTGNDSERGKGKGKGFTRNIPMMGGSGDREFFSAYHDLLPRMVKEFDASILMVSAGYDIHKDDPLASIRVSDEGIRDMVKSILSLGLPTVFSLEGGYNLKALAASVLITIEEMMKD